MTNPERRLTVIVSADVAGYSRLMEVDEPGTVMRLKAILNEIVHPQVTAGHGRVMKLMGDGFLAEFPSVADALRAVLAIQAELADRDTALSAPERIRFRIGITVGDILVEDDDIYGRAINVAARIQTLAEPGSVYLSDSARAQIGNLLDAHYEDLGEHRVKNIREPVRVFRVVTGATTGGAPSSPDAVMPGKRLSIRFSYRSWQFQVLALLVIVGVAWAWTQRQAPPPGHAAPPAGTQPTRVQEASIAVLPFADMSPKKDQEYFSDGITEELLNRLVRVKGLRVAARTSAFAFKGKNEDVRKIGSLLGVSTVIEGSVRKAGDKLRITAQLINVADGYHLWSQSFTRELTDVFAIQDEIAQAIVVALKENLLGEELAGQAAPITSRAPNMEAWDLYLLGRHHFHQRTVASLAKAAELFQRAIAQDPDYAPAYTGLADAYMLLNSYGNLPFDEALAKARPAIERALELDPQLGEAYASLGLLREAYLGDSKSALQAYRRAIDLNPNYPMAYMWMGNAFAREGLIRDATRAYTRAHLLDPLHPTIATNLVGMHIATGEYEKGKAVVDKLLAAGVTGPITYRALSNLEGAFGRYDEAARWAHKAALAEPGQPASLVQLAGIYQKLGDFNAAERWLSAAEKLAPRNFDVFGQRFGLLVSRREHQRLIEFADSRLRDVKGDPDSRIHRTLRSFAGAARILAGRYAAGAEQMQAALLADGTTGFGIQVDINVLGMLSFAYQKLDRNADATRALASLLAVVAKMQKEGFAGPVWHAGEATVRILQGDPAGAVSALQAAYAAGWRDYFSVIQDPLWVPTRKRPDAQALLSRVKTDLDAMRQRVEAMKLVAPTDL